MPSERQGDVGRCQEASMVPVLRRVARRAPCSQTLPLQSDIAYEARNALYSVTHLRQLGDWALITHGRNVRHSRCWLDVRSAWRKDCTVTTNEEVMKSRRHNLRICEHASGSCGCIATLQSVTNVHNVLSSAESLEPLSCASSSSQSNVRVVWS